MRYATHPVRPGLTAIAAVLALSSTPSFAQAADPAAPAPIVTPPPVVAAPAPAPVESAPATMSSTSSAPSGGLVTVPIRPGTSTVIAPTNTAPAPAPAVEPEAATPAPAPVARSTSRSTPAPRATTTAPAAAPAAAPIAAPAERLAPVAPVVAPAAAPAPVAKAPAPQPAAADTAAADTADDTLPVAGGIGAAILLLGGGLYALNRRRRDEVEEVHTAETVETREPPMTAAPEVYAAPAVAATAAPVAPEPVYAEPVYAEPGKVMPANRIPDGFDTSRFGRHVQAAYRGPTPDNPFLSLKRRVKRASFYDMRERMAAQGDLPMAQPAAAAASRPATAPRQTEYVTTRVQRPPRPGFRPAYQG